MGRTITVDELANVINEGFTSSVIGISLVPDLVLADSTTIYCISFSGFPRRTSLHSSAAQ